MLREVSPELHGLSSIETGLLAHASCRTGWRAGLSSLTHSGTEASPCTWFWSLPLWRGRRNTTAPFLRLILHATTGHNASHIPLTARQLRGCGGSWTVLGEHERLCYSWPEWSLQRKELFLYCWPMNVSASPENCSSYRLQVLVGWFPDGRDVCASSHLDRLVPALKSPGPAVSEVAKVPFNCNIMT